MEKKMENEMEAVIILGIIATTLQEDSEHDRLTWLLAQSCDFNLP